MQHDYLGTKPWQFKEDMISNKKCEKHIKL